MFTKARKSLFVPCLVVVSWLIGAATYAQQECDVCVNGINNCGQSCGGGGTTSRCPTSAPLYCSNNGGYCCDRAHPYCSTDGQCSASSTGGGGNSCPSSAPLFCSNNGGYCCDRAHPYCTSEGRCSASSSSGGDGPSCPSDAPLYCSNAGGYCCDRAHPYCTNEGGCSSSAGGGGGGGGGAGGGVSCPSSTPLYCTNNGGYCCDSAHPYCTSTGLCSSSATSEGGGGGGGTGTTSTPCNGFPTCGDSCTNAFNPVCCSNGFTAPSEDLCLDDDDAGGCSLGSSPTNTPSWSTTLLAAALAFLVRRRRLARTA